MKLFELNGEVVLIIGAELTERAVLQEGRLAKWQVPDNVDFVESLPIDATGKSVKHQLCERFADHFIQMKGVAETLA